jgi:glycosyltransferase involved in cell wall biosynthesis
MPHHATGYAIRTHWLVRTLRAKSWDLSVYTRFGYPNDRYDFIGASKVAPHARVDGVPYLFNPSRRGFATLPIEAYHAAAVEGLLRQASVFRPALIHCASDWRCGLVGTEAARRLGVPCIYEVRGLWHLTRVAKQPEYEGSDHYRMITSLEALAASNADHVFAITQAVKDILVGEGVSPEKISILPNAVDTTQFAIRERDRALAEKFHLGDATVIGYIGSFNAYEGLEYLLQAAAKLRARAAKDFRVLLVGDGATRDRLSGVARQLGISDIVSFAGRVPHDQIGDYYSLIDIMVFPRKGVSVCEVVSPLKPFEAMATGKVVVASNVRALAEIVEHENTGLLHAKDEVDSLREQLERLLVDGELRSRLASNGLAWVREQRSWSRIAAQVEGVYRDLIDGAAASPRTPEQSSIRQPAASTQQSRR